MPDADGNGRGGFSPDEAPPGSGAPNAQQARLREAPSGSGRPMISVQGLHKRFGTHEVLRGIDLDIPEGSTCVILGGSGSGKSVLMKHLIGLLKPDRGRVIVDDVDINEVSYKELRRVRRQFGVLFQGGALFDSMTAFDNIAFPLRTFSDANEAEVRRRVRECLEMVQLEGIETKKPSELSGGMQKRVALARAISLEPKYIIYDEPTSGLDPETSNRIDELINALNNHLNVTSIVITHDMHSVLSIADRIAFVYRGRIHWTGTVDDLHESNDEILL